MKAPSKSMIMILIAVILLFVIIAIILPDNDTVEKANLIVVSNTDTPIGAIQVNYTRWDGSLVSEGIQNADGSMLLRGDEARFAIISWPATVYVYADQQGMEVLAAIVIETAPEDSGIWTATIYDSEIGLTVSLE